MYEQVMAWAGLALLFVLCLPLAGLSKLILELSTWVLRLSLLALLAGAAYVWFYPAQMPAEIPSILGRFPELSVYLPDPSVPYYGVTLAAAVVLVLLPLLAVLDVTRKLAGQRLRRIRVLTNPTVVEVPRAAVAQTAERPVPVLRRDRRAAADTLAAVRSRRSV